MEPVCEALASVLLEEVFVDVLLAEEAVNLVQHEQPLNRHLLVRIGFSVSEKRVFHFLLENLEHRPLAVISSSCIISWCFFASAMNFAVFLINNLLNLLEFRVGDSRIFLRALRLVFNF